MKTRKTLFLIAMFTIIITGYYTQKSVASTTLDFLFDWQMVSPYSPYLLADEEGYYAAEGIKINFIEGQGAETSAKLIGQGKYKIGTSNAAATAIAIDNGIPIISIAMIEKDAVTAIFSLAKNNIKKPEDLIGKKLGVRYYDISHKEYLAMMKSCGISTEKVKEISVGWELQPLITGQIDALYNYAYNMPVVLEQQGFPVNMILVKDYGVDGYGSNIIANREFAKENKNIIVGFLRASRKGWEAAIANPDKAIAVLKKRYPETNTKVALAILKAQLQWISNQNKEYDLFYQSATRWAKVIKTYMTLGVIKDDLKVNSVFTNNYLGKQE